MKLPSKKLMLVQIFLIFVLPVFLIYFNILPVSWRMILLGISALVIYGIIRKEEWSYEDMGLHHHNFNEAWWVYLSFTLLGVFVLFILHDIFNMPDISSKTFIILTCTFFIPISFFQEFVFRVFLMPRLKAIYKNDLFVIFINTILFTLMHIIYSGWVVILPLVFLSGILFAWLYLKYPNMVLVSITHAVLNITAVLLGFFVIN